MKQTFEEFKEKYKDTSYENILHQFYFEHNDLLEMNQANELLFEKSQISNNKIQKAIEYIESELKNIDDEISWVEMPTESYMKQCNELLDILTR